MMNTHERSTKVLRKCGKRAVADRIMINVRGALMAHGYSSPRDTFCGAVQILKPMVTLSSEKRSGQTIQIPAARSASCQEGKALRILRSGTLVGAGRTNSRGAVLQSQQLGDPKAKLDDTVARSEGLRHRSGANKLNTHLNSSKGGSHHNARTRSSAESMAQCIISIRAALNSSRGDAKLARSSEGVNSTPLGMRNTIHRMAVAQLGATR